MTAARLRGDWLALVAGFAVVMAVELVLILWNTDGNFTYTLDDPYIHLALAENLAGFLVVLHVLAGARLVRKMEVGAFHQPLFL